MANLVVVEGDLLVESPKIEATWIDGIHHPGPREEKKENGPDKDAKPEAPSLRREVAR
jgi:hypothetical protein